MNQLAHNELDSIWIPPGFAHGFLSLDDNTFVLNRCTKGFDPKLERGIKWNDSYFNISWGISNVILSEKDNNWPPFVE